MANKRREAEPLTKHLVNLFQGDFDRLQDLHPRLGAGKVIRMLVRAHIKRAEEHAAQKVKPVTVDPDKVELI